MSDKFWEPNVTFGSTVQAAGSIFGGISSYGAARSAAGGIRAEGAIAYAESLRSANIIRKEGQKFAANQTLQYIASGVQVMGSALITVAQTKKYAETEAKAEEMRGRNLRSMANYQASAREAEGRAAMISGILGGIGSFF